MMMMMMMLLIQWVTTTARSALIGFCEDDWQTHPDSRWRVRDWSGRTVSTSRTSRYQHAGNGCVRDRLILGADNKTYQQRRIIETDITINQTHIPDGWQERTNTVWKRIQNGGDPFA